MNDPMLWHFECDLVPDTQFRVCHEFKQLARFVVKMVPESETRTCALETLLDARNLTITANHHDQQKEKNRTT